MPRSSTHLSYKGLLTTVSQAFEKIDKDKVSNRLPLRDCLLSGLAVFGLKSSSLLQFDKDAHDDSSAIKVNLVNLYTVSKVPSDTYLRERLDEVDPLLLRKPFNKLLAQVQRSKKLENYQYYQGKYLISCDGTGVFNSQKVHCENCCVKEHRNGSTSYYHQLLCASIVHPDIKQVLPLAPEAIIKQDGSAKNDCERNAAKRLMQHIRREHPHLGIIIVEDGLASNAPHIELLKEYDMSYILGVKPGDHKWLFDYVAVSGLEKHLLVDELGTEHEFEFVNNVPLNDSRSDILVNFLRYTETDVKGNVKKFSWVSDFSLSKANVYKIMRGARARWKIENETFNTLKNQGYNFEHNYGHGNKYLCTVFANLMLLAFLIDQIQELACPLFQEALKNRGSRKRLWDRMRILFGGFYICEWDDLFIGISGKAIIPVLINETG